MKQEFVICVDGLPANEREKFLKGFMNTFGSSKLSFEPPYEFNVREVTEQERTALEACNENT